MANEDQQPNRQEMEQNLRLGMSSTVSTSSGCSSTSSLNLPLSFPRVFSGPSSDGSGSSSSSSMTFPAEDILFSCDIHPTENCLHYCSSCRLAICHLCLQESHLQHNTERLTRTIVEDAHRISRQMNENLKETYIGLNVTKQIISSMFNKLLMKSQEIKNQINCIFLQYMDLLNRRKQELLQELHALVLDKSTKLEVQCDNFGQVMQRVSCIAQLYNTETNIFVSNKLIAQEIERLATFRISIEPCENDDIFFTQPQINVRALMDNLGSVGATKVQKPVLRPVRLPMDFPRKPTEELPNEICAARPIYGLEKRVKVRNYSMSPCYAFGKKGDAQEQLSRPWGVCVDASNRMYIADRSNNRIVSYYSSGVFSHSWGSAGTANGQFQKPAGIAVHPTGNIAVVDKDNHRVQIFKPSGKFLFTFGSKGNGPGQFNYPWDIACNSKGQIVVSDTRNHRVHLISYTGEFLHKFGYECGSGATKLLDSPRGVCFTPGGNVVITDFNMHRILMLSPDLKKVLGVAGGEGRQIDEFSRPQGIICDDYGNFVVADSKNHRIKVLDKNFKVLLILGSEGTACGQFKRPTGVALTPLGELVVVDFENDRIEMF